MKHAFHTLAFTPSVKAQQRRYGSLGNDVSGRSGGEASPDDAYGRLLGPQEAAFLDERDSFYLASVSETGWPYVQHRGGPAGFLKVLDEKTLGWADFAGNRQYISMGNVAMDDRVALIVMDYARRGRIKIMGRLTVHEAKDRPDLREVLAVPGYRARIERIVLVAVEAFDWNCPQHIQPRFSAAEIEPAIASLRARITDLERQLAEAGTPARKSAEEPD